MDSTNFWMRINNRIKLLQTTQEWVAAQSGIKYQTLRGWVTKGIFPRANEATALAKTLDTSVEELVTGRPMGSSLSGEMLQLARDIASLPQDDIDELKAIVALKKEKHRGAKAKASVSARSASFSLPTFLVSVCKVTNSF